MSNKKGQASLEYSIMFVMIIVVVTLFSLYFKKTVSTVLKHQLDTIVDQVEDDNCCYASDGICREEYRDDFCGGDNCAVPICLVIPSDCTPEEIFSDNCDELDN